MLDYRKPKEGRVRSVGSSPRDRQMRVSSGVDNHEEVTYLLSQIDKLNKELDRLKTKSNNPNSISDEELNSIIVREVEKESEKIKYGYELKLTKYLSEIESLRNEISLLKQTLKDKDSIINTLSETIKNSSKVVYTNESGSTIIKEELDRPDIEPVVIDPTDGNNDLESFIEVDEVSDTSIKNKAAMSEKLSKLKDILG